jgi:hypothetical protein
MAPLTPSVAPGLTIRAARVIGGKTVGGRDRLTQALGHVSLAALGIGPRATLVLGRVTAPRPLTADGGSVPFARGLEEGLRQRAARARHDRSGANADGDWLFEDVEAVEVALVAAALAPGPRPAWLASLTGTPTPNIAARWRRHILTDGLAAARIIARLAEAQAGADAGTGAASLTSRGAMRGLAVAWLARFEPIELVAAAARICLAHGGVGVRDADLRGEPAGPDAGDPTADHSAASLARLQPAARIASQTPTLVATLAALAPEARAAPEGSPLRALLMTALVAHRRPALVTLPAFARAATAAPPPPSKRAATAPNPDHPRAAAARTTLPAPPPTPRQPIREGAAQAVAGAIAAPAPPYGGAAPAIDTQFAGMGFLLNAFVALGLWGDFTRPDDTLAGLSPFELLILLGRHWYDAPFVADALHAALRDAAGLAPREPAGRHFAAPDWEPPRAWLTPWGPGDASAGPSRRPGWHSAGFPLADLRENRTPASRRRFWVAALSRYLAARLALALGEANPRAARDLACRRPGAFVLSSEALTLRMALADHPLAIRMAGLDRDPGRLAGTDRPVLFEFSS